MQEKVNDGEDPSYAKNVILARSSQCVFFNV